MKFGIFSLTIRKISLEKGVATTSNLVIGVMNVFSLVLINVLLVMKRLKVKLYNIFYYIIIEKEKKVENLEKSFVLLNSFS